MSQIVIAAFIVIFLILAMSAHVDPLGESANYIVSTFVFERNPFSQRILPEDIERVRYEFPTQYEFSLRTSYFTDSDGNRYPWYFPTYSVAVIPVKHLLSFIGVTATKAYQVSNVLYYAIALLFVYFFLNKSRKTIFLTILLLTCSPAVMYYHWISAEMFICSLLIITLVFWVNGNRHLAGLFCAIASTLNITIIGICFAIIVDYFIADYTKRGVAFMELIKKNWKRTLLLGLCFVPALFMPIHNLIIAESLNLQNALVAEGAIVSGWFGRFIAYLFDLNLGFLPYFPILLIILFVTLILAIIKKSISIVMIISGFLMTVILYAGMPHINSGMTTIARYNAWASPFLVFCASALLPVLLKSTNTKRLLSGLCAISAVLTVTVTGVVMSHHRGDYVFFNPIAKAVLEHAPALYNPLPSTFIGRTRHIDWGYTHTHEPTIYANENGFVRKILVPRGTAHMVMDMVYGDEQALYELAQKVDKVKINDREYAYINVCGTVFLDEWGLSFNPTERQDLQHINNGIHGWEETFHWFSPDARVKINAGELKNTGLQLEVIFVPYVQIFNDDDILRTDVYVDDVLVYSFLLENTYSFEDRTVLIGGNELPESETGFYEIVFLTNGAFNPSTTIYEDVYNPNDARDLAIGVMYIGPPR